MSKRMLASVALVAVMAAGAAGVALAGRAFSDVPESHPRSSDIAYAVAQGWFVGYDDGTFRPDQVMPHHQIVTVVKRAFPEGSTRAEMAAFLRAGERALTGGALPPGGGTSTTSTTLSSGYRGLQPEGPPVDTLKARVGNWRLVRSEDASGSSVGYCTQSERTSPAPISGQDTPELCVWRRADSRYEDSSWYVSAYVSTPWRVLGREYSHVQVRWRLSGTNPASDSWLSSEDRTSAVFIATSTFDRDDRLVVEEIRRAPKGTKLFISIWDKNSDHYSFVFDISYSWTMMTNLGLSMKQE